MIEKYKVYFPLAIAVVIGVLLVNIPLFIYLYLLRHPYTFTKPPSPLEGYLYVTPTKFNTPVTIVPSPTNIPVAIVSLNLGEPTWLQFPVATKIDAYQLPNSDGYVGGSNIVFKDIKYIHVANYGDGSKLISAMVPSEGMGMWYQVEHFIKLPNGQIYYVIANKETFATSPVSNYLKTNIKYTDIKIPGIETPDSFTSDKGTFYPTGYFFDNTISFTELKNPQLITATQYGRVYSVYTPLGKDSILPDDTKLYDRKTWLRLSDDTVKAYEIKQSFISDDRIPQITWNDGTANTIAYEPGFGGKCGSNYATLFKDDSSIKKSLIPAGTNSLGQTIYTISDNTNPILKKAYENLDPSSRPDFETFLKRKNHFVWQDSFGDWWLFLSSENKIQAECAKPVIYLYPQKSTQVTVQVGASVTQSEPNYPWNGWSVLAHPSGRIDYQNKSYPNLFWEGMGYGVYANHANEGFVIPQSKLIKTVIFQLKQQGLKKQEIDDFMDFWQEKLPKTPYVRLTWLDTADMNILAPLSVTPHPKTVIRVFLEFEGLDKFVRLSPQKLTAPKRTGFTLVEWGGLLLK